MLRQSRCLGDFLERKGVELRNDLPREPRRIVPLMLAVPVPIAAMMLCIRDATLAIGDS